MRLEDEKSLAGLLLAFGVILAFYVPGLSDFFAPFLLPSLFCVMVFSLLPFARVKADDLLKLHPIVLTLVMWQQFLLPAIVILLSRLLNLDDQIIYFVILTLTSGSLFASPTLVQIMGLDQRIAVQTVVVSTVVAPISIFAIFSLLQAGAVDLHFTEFGIRLFWFLVIPMCIFFAARLLISNWDESRKDKVDWIGRWGSVISLIVFCFALEFQVIESLKNSMGKLSVYLFIAISVAVFSGVTTRIILSKFGKRAAATATVLASFRNVGLTFGLVGSIAGPEVAVYVGISQIPMFCAPLLFDLFITKSRKEYAKPQESNAPEIEQEIPQTTNITPNPNQHAQISNISPMPKTSLQHVSKSMTLNNQSNPQTITSSAISGNTARKLEVDVEYQVEPIPFDPKSITDIEVRDKMFQKVDDARSLLDRLEKEIKSAASGFAGRPGMYLMSFFIFAVIGITSVWHANKYFYPMLFDDQMVSDVAQAHSEGKNFGVFDLNINIRDLRNETIKRMKKTPDVVVLGASHWQEAHVNLLPGYDFYNSHVHRDYYEDMLAVTEMWVRHNRLPKEMIITIRDNLFTPVEDRTDFLWYPGIKYYRDFAERIDLEPHAWWETLPYQTWRELLSLELLIPQAKTHLLADVMPHATNGRNFETLDTLLPGGSILWSGEHKRLFSQERARYEALSFAEAKKNNPPVIDPKGVAHIEALFDFLVENGVRVTLANPQFNPLFWDEVKDTPYRDGLRKVEELTQNWAKKYGFAMIGGFAPESVGCRADQYIDAEHGNPNCLGLLLGQYDAANGRTPKSSQSSTNTTQN